MPSDPERCHVACRGAFARAGRAPEVTVEVHLANGLPSFSIVGLPDLEVRESRERVRAALQNCGFEFPVRRITVNLAPADLPKESGRFDLPIALDILAASGQIPPDALHEREFAGELSLTGALRPMRGAFAMACRTARSRRRAASAASAAGAIAASVSSEAPGAPPELYLPAASAGKRSLRSLRLLIFCEDRCFFPDTQTCFAAKPFTRSSGWTRPLLQLPEYRASGPTEGSVHSRLIDSASCLHPGQCRVGATAS